MGTCDTISQWTCMNYICFCGGFFHSLRVKPPLECLSSTSAMPSWAAASWVCRMPCQTQALSSFCKYLYNPGSSIFKMCGLNLLQPWRLQHFRRHHQRGQVNGSDFKSEFLQIHLEKHPFILFLSGSEYGTTRQHSLREKQRELQMGISSDKNRSNLRLVDSLSCSTGFATAARSSEPDIIWGHASVSDLITLTDLANLPAFSLHKKVVTMFYCSL